MHGCCLQVICSHNYITAATKEMLPLFEIRAGPKDPKAWLGCVKQPTQKNFYSVLLA